MLLPSPFLATVALAAPAIALAGTAAQREALLPGIAAGRTRATLAIANEDGAPGLDGIGPRLTRSRRGWRLDGAAGFVDPRGCSRSAGRRRARDGQPLAPMA